MIEGGASKQAASSDLYSRIGIGDIVQLQDFRRNSAIT
jgi:hypothetical protein